MSARLRRAGAETKRSIIVARSERISREELMQMVIEEVDHARDIQQLAEQFVEFLPIRSMDELIKAVGDKELQFRDTPFDVATLAAHIPSIAFPVEDARGLVERLGYIVRIAPPALGVDLESPEGIRRRLRHTSSLASNLGMMQANNVAASPIVAGAMPPDFTPGTAGPERADR